MSKEPCTVELYWIPVGAGTSRFQQGSLRLWEAFEAARARRARATLLHSALKLTVAGAETYTVELTPAFVHWPVVPAMTGPVGFRGADRFRLFRYQLVCVPVDSLADEEWAVEAPVRLSDDPRVARAVLDLASSVPPYTWGRRLPRTKEMWTSDSVVSWLLVKAGIEPESVQVPAGGRAPGWDIGAELASRSR